MNEQDYSVAFSHCDGIGPMRLQELLSHYKTLAKAYHASESQLRELLGEKLAENFVIFRKTFSVKEVMGYCNAEGIVPVGLFDPRYPAPLKNISDSPICLYVKGDLKNFHFERDFIFAIVGTRKPSSYGMQITRQFSRGLSEAGAVIVSGMALGVDTISHEEAIAVGERTIAVLGCGVDICYPPSNQGLYDAIISSGNVILSEFPPRHTVLRGLFVARNRLISGLSRGVLLTEGTHKSGGLITCRYAAEQGKEVFAPPVPLTSALSEAPNIVLREGATFTTSVKDILEVFNVKVIQKERRKTILSESEQLVYTTLINQCLSSDELVQYCKFSIHILLTVLSGMEVKGIVEKNREGRYQIVSLT